MMNITMKILVVVSIFVLALVNYSNQDSRKEVVKLSLYYEPLCSASLEFINLQLELAYQRIGSSMDVKFNPYGNTKKTFVDGHWKFDCQHGEKECELGRITACGLPHLNQNQQMSYVVCLASDKTTEDECITRVGLSAATIQSCAKGEEGEKLFAEYGVETDNLKPPHEYVPWIIFGNKYNETLAEEAQDNLQKVVCSLLSHKPSGCAELQNLTYLTFDEKN